MFFQRSVRNIISALPTLVKIEMRLFFFTESDYYSGRMKDWPSHLFFVKKKILSLSLDLFKYGNVYFRRWIDHQTSAG